MIKLSKHLSITAILLLIYVIGYSQAEDSCTVVIKVLNNERPANVFLSVEGSKYSKPVSQIINCSGECIKSFRIKTDMPIKFRISGNIPMQMGMGILYPGDSIIATCDYGQKQLTLTGKAALVSQYYTAINKNCSGNYFVNPSDVNPENYLKYFLSLTENYRCKDSMYNAILSDKKIPEWFPPYLKKDITYDLPSSMLYTIHSNNSNRANKFYANPEMMLWFRDIPLNDPAAINNSAYYDFLLQYFLWKEKISWIRGSNQKMQISWVTKILPNVQKELIGTVKEWFLTKVMVNYYNLLDVYEVDGAANLVKPLIKDPRYQAEMDAARAKSVEARDLRFAKSAKVGSKAPGFYLKDSLDVYYSIAKFRGNWLLLRFHNSDSFNTINNSSDSAHLHDVEYVNIYIDKDPLYWKKKLKNKPYVGLHLFSRGNWGEMLTNLYGLESFPYYVLVDPDGVIRYSKAGSYSEVFSIVKN